MFQSLAYKLRNNFTIRPLVLYILEDNFLKQLFINVSLLQGQENSSLINRRCYFLFFTAGANASIISSFIGALKIFL